MGQELKQFMTDPSYRNSALKDVYAQQDSEYCDTLRRIENDIASLENSQETEENRKKLEDRKTDLEMVKNRPPVHRIPDCFRDEEHRNLSDEAYLDYLSLMDEKRKANTSPASKPLKLLWTVVQCFMAGFFMVAGCGGIFAEDYAPAIVIIIVGAFMMPAIRTYFKEHVWDYPKWFMPLFFVLGFALFTALI